MSKLEYLSQIAHAKSARELHNLKHQAETDGELNPAEQSAIGVRISRKFAELNRVNHPKPRWA